MLGDLILVIGRWLHQNFFCVHDYRQEHCGEYDYTHCIKCGKLEEDGRLTLFTIAIVVVIVLIGFLLYLIIS